ncbi:hypothetical protein EU522_00795 [Candidatus Thorarchaeota archaeon]|nr:MAG: hypothetical protein EU522_00795 [Candidatus Thorarchaeota archaeon]
MDDVSKKTLLQIGNLLTPILCGVVIALSGLDFSSTVISDAGYPKILNPAAFTFAIWGPIFIFQFMFYFYQARDIFRSRENKIEMPYVHEVSIFFMLSWISTSAWYVLWGLGLVWPAVGAMFAYLLSSLGAYLRLGINLRPRSLKEHLFVTVAWSLLAGWVTVAAIVNTTTGFVYSGFDSGPIGEDGWASIILLMALGIYLLVLVRRNDFVFAGVGFWAIVGVIADLVDPVNMAQPSATLVAILGAGILSVAMIVWFYLQNRRGIISFPSFRDFNQDGNQPSHD